MRVQPVISTISEQAKPDVFSCLSFVNKARELWDKNPLFGRVTANWQESIFIVATAISVIGAVRAFFMGMGYYCISFLVLAGISALGRHFAQLYSVAETFKEEGEKYKQENEKLKASVQKICVEVDKFYKGNAIFGEHLDLLGRTSLDNKEAVDAFKTQSGEYITKLAGQVTSVVKEYDSARQFLLDIKNEAGNAMKDRAEDLKALYAQINKAQTDLAVSQVKYEAYLKTIEHDRETRQKDQAAFMTKLEASLKEKMGTIAAKAVGQMQSLKTIPPEIQQRMREFQDAATAELQKFAQTLAEAQYQSSQPDGSAPLTVVINRGSPLKPNPRTSATESRDSMLSLEDILAMGAPEPLVQDTDS